MRTTKNNIPILGKKEDVKCICGKVVYKTLGGAQEAARNQIDKEVWNGYQCDLIPGNFHIGHRFGDDAIPVKPERELKSIVLPCGIDDTVEINGDLYIRVSSIPPPKVIEPVVFATMTTAKGESFRVIY